MHHNHSTESMNPSSQYVPYQSDSAYQQATLSFRRSHSDMQSSRSPSRWVDYEYYLNNVLRVPSDTTEDGIDRKLRKLAEELGLNTLQLSTNVAAITSSMSATTIASNPTIQSSILSQSTAPTSCSSSEIRPLTASVHKSNAIPEHVSDYVPSIASDIEKRRRNTGFRDGFRRMTGFSKKKKPVPAPAPAPKLNSVRSSPQLNTFVISDGHSVASGMNSPSMKSKESSDPWSRRLSTTDKSSYEHEVPIIDHDALSRSMECKEMISLRARQLEERQRFLDYQSELVSKIRAQRDTVKKQKSAVHEGIVDEQRAKNDKAAEDLETHHLEDETKMRKEHSLEKRTVMVRLRHMEAYCQTPSPPAMPSDFLFLARSASPHDANTTRSSVDSANPSSPTAYIPERKVTDKDYHNLAQQYRERDAMDNLHTSKINVLRGRQQRALENFMLKRERDIEKLESEQQKELDVVDFEFGRQEADCRSEFDVLRRRLENRWRVQAKIERKKREDSTGLKFESLPDVLCIDNCSVELMLRPTEVSTRTPMVLPFQATSIAAR